MTDRGHGDRRTWNTVYLQFGLGIDERARLDAHLRARDVTLGMLLRRTLDECLREAGVEPPDGAAAPAPPRND